MAVTQLGSVFAVFVMQTNSGQFAMTTQSLKSYGIQAMLHLLGVVFVCLLLLMPYIDGHIAEGFFLAMEYSEFQSFTATELALHVGLSASLWALVVITFKLLMLKRKRRKILKVARGTAVTETLIILPVWIMLSMGLLQLSVMNIAGILANLATFQAARTVWVWAGETSQGVSYMTVMTKARVQAAYALAPVAPGDYIHNPIFVSNSFKAARAGMVAQQIPLLTQDQGNLGYPLAYALELEDPGGLIRTGGAGDLSLWRSLDGTSFRTRSVRKFTFAYNATTVVPFMALTRTGCLLIYSQQIAMPLAPWVFGERSIVGGRPGYYRRFIREFNFQGQVPANRRFPN